MHRLSGLQKEALHLYRQWIRLIAQKPKDNQINFLNYVHSEFGKYRGLPRKEFTTIEYLIRTGNRKLKEYSNPNLKNIH